MPPSPPTTAVTSAPGSLMLMGEHAVLRGYPALCMAVAGRIRLHMVAIPEREVDITSDLGSWRGSLDDPRPADPFRFVLEAIRRHRPPTGIRLTIDSEIEADRGLGSSAAVTVATLAGLRALRGEPFDRADILTCAREVIHAVQGSGSGSDAAASTYGGVVRIDPEPFRVEPLHVEVPFAMGYAGYKTSTPVVLAHVESLRERRSDLYDRLDAAIGHCVDEAVDAIRNGDVDHLGHLMNVHHGLQAALGTSDRALENLVHGFREQPDVVGAKISGSGLGDSVLALGNPDAKVEGFVCGPVRMDSEGVRLES